VLVRLSHIDAGFKPASAFERSVSIGRRVMIAIVLGLIAAGVTAWLVQRKFVPPI
jgi:hypothetical protein